MSSPSLRAKSRTFSLSWKTQSAAVRVLRIWLGFTWVYAGWNKATDPGFLSRTGTTYIGRQLTGYSTNSPLGFFFRHLIEHATVIGLIVMVVEFAIGFATIFWIAPTLAAFAGFAMSVGLWTAATWHVTPYFLASDTAYAVLWLVYFLTLLGTRRRIDVALDRRGAMRIALLAFASVGAALIGNIGFKTPSKVKNLQLTPSASGTSGGGSGAATQNQIIKLADLPVGKSYEFASADGLPAIVFRTKNGVFAYSEICTHQGCTVSYVPAYKALICPCHGATYDAFNGAAVIGGPAPAPLAPVKVAISGDWVVQA